jgi:hypothetical protein
MCNQTVGLVAAEIERAGIPTAGIVYLHEAAEAMRPPRILWVPFPHGYALGKPDDVALQLDVLRQALALLDEPGPGPVLKDYVPLGQFASASSKD